MGEPPIPASFFDALRDLTAWLDNADAPCAIIGGIAASILGRPRATRDIADIEAILEVHDGLDLDRVHSWLREFSAALDKPEILEDFQAIHQRRFR